MKKVPQNVKDDDFIYLPEAAKIMGLKLNYVRDYWPKLIPVMPRKPYPKYRKIRFLRSEFNAFLLQPK